MKSQEFQIPKFMTKALSISAKNLGVAFLLAVLFTAFLAYDSDPTVNVYRLDAGEKYTSPAYMAEYGDSIQVGFAVTELNGQELDYDYVYETEEDFWNQGEEPLIRMTVESSENRDFSESEVVVVLAGTSLSHQFENPGIFYKVTVENVSGEQLEVVSGTAEANLALVIITALVFAWFGIAMGIFQLVLHLFLWGLVILGAIWLVNYGMPRVDEHFAKKYADRAQSMPQQAVQRAPYQGPRQD